MAQTLEIVALHHPGNWFSDCINAQHGAGIDITEEMAHALIGRMAQQFHGATALQNRPLLHQCDPITQSHGFIEVMGDEHHRAALILLQIQQQILHLAADQWIKGRERLIHQQNRWIQGQGACQSHPLLHATGEFFGPFAQIAPQSHPLKGGPCPLQSLGSW